MKILIKSTLILTIICASSILTYQFLVKRNRYVYEWDNLPVNVKKQAIILSVEMLYYNINKPEIDQQLTSVITVEDIKHSIVRGADWILRVQNSSGRFKYSYNPQTGKYGPKNLDNFLRQAGTGYSLMLAYEAVGNKDYLNAAKQNLSYLMTFKENLDSTKSYFKYAQKAKLGGIALPMLTMLKIKALENDSSFDKELQNLANMLLHLQDYYNSGKFKSTYFYRGDYEYEKHSGWESKIYPGEALLALSLMYKEFNDEKYKEAIDDALTYYANDGWMKKVSFIPWTTSALYELYNITHDSKYSDFIFKMCDYTLKRQNMNADKIFYGSFDPIPTIFTATSFEGIGDALSVCKQLNKEEKFIQYKNRTLIAYHWIMQLQYDGTDSIASGGFKQSLHNDEIRIDNTQHAISALSKGLKYLYSPN